MEIWKDIPGYEDRYQVSNLGNVKNAKGNTLKPCKHRLGYLFVKLSTQGNSSCFYIHRLVAQAFLGSTLELTEVDHLNANKLDNRLENLEWVSRAENIRRAAAKGLLKNPDNKGAKNGMAKLTVENVRLIKKLRGSDTQENIAKMFGVSRRAVGLIYSGQRWGHI